MNQKIIGHAAAMRGIEIAIEKGRFSGTFLLVGPPGIGKATIAKRVAKSLLCDAATKNQSPLEPCGRCESCAQVEADSHPDLVQVRKPEDRATIPLELLIGPPDSRMREGFCRDIRLRPFKGTRKVAILHDADDLNEEGANSLLKTLEEPPPDSVLFLIATNEQRQLPTVRSRCRIIRLSPPRGDDAAALMHCHGVTCDADAADDAIELCGGDCEAAASLLSGNAQSFRDDFARQLATRPVPVMSLTKNVTEFVDQAGKEASLRRNRLRDVFAIATATFREELKTVAADITRIDPVTYRIDRTLEAINQVQRNANQTTLIETWASDIARGTQA